MSDSVLNLLELFDALPESEKQSALSEILRRVRFGERDVPAEQLDGLAAELFAGLDAEEAAHADR
jgi:hypothetical protein